MKTIHSSPSTRAASIRSSRTKRVVFLLAAALFAGHYAQADTTESVWSGASSMTWATSGNWGANGVPSSTVSAEFSGTFTNQPTLGTTAATAEGIWVTGAGNTGVSGLTTIGGTGVLTVTGNATLDSLTNAGILLDGAGNNSLTISAPVTLSNSTSFLVNNTGTLTLQTGAVSLGATTLTLGGTNASGNIAISSIMSGTGGVVVNTSGTTKLSGANTFTGGLTLTAGTLNANTSANALGNGALNLNGGTLELNGSAGLNFSTALGTTTVGGTTTITSDKSASGAGVTYTFGALSVGAHTLNVSGGSNVASGTAGVTFGAVTLTGNETFNVTNPTSGSGTTELTLGVLSDGGAGYTVTKNGNGSLYLSGTPSTDSGAITVNAGTLFITGTSAGTSSITVENGATLGRGDGGGSSYHPTNALIVPDNATANFIGNANGGGLDMDGTSAFGNGSTINVVNSSTVPRGVSFSGVITLGDSSGTGNVNLSMAAITSFGIANNINGQVVDNGTSTNSFTITSTTAGNFVELSGGTNEATSTFKGGVTLDSGAVLEINGTSTGSAVGATVTKGPIGTGTLTLNGGTIGGTPTLANAVAINGTNQFGTAAGTNLPNSTIVLNGPTTIASGAVLNSAPFTGLTTITGISGTNTITVGSTTGLASGQFVAGTGIGAGAKISSISTATDVVTLSVNNSGTVSGNGTFNNTDTTTFGDTVALNGNITVEPSINSSFTFGGAIGDGGHGYGLTVGNGSTTGTVILSGANTFTGEVTINSGSVQLGNSGALNSTTPNAVTFGSGSTGALKLNGQSVTVAGLTTNATVGTPIVENASTSATSTLTISNSAGSTYAGVIEDGGSESLALTKSGAGGLNLSGANTYTGATTVTAGNLTVLGSTASGSAVSVNGGTFTVTGSVGGTVAVASGATLSGTGTAGAVTVAGGGNLNLKDGIIGTLTLGALTTGNATTPSALSFDIQTVSGTTTLDSIADTGILTLTGTNGTTITIGNVNGSTTSLTDGTYDLLNYSGTYTGSLSDLSLATTSLDGDTLSLVQGTGEIELQVTDEVVFPSDAGVYNVMSYGATGNGTTDDTAAFQAAIKAALNAGGSGPSSGRYGAIIILYVPNGTYLLSNTLQNQDGDTSFSDGWIAGMYIQGQSQTGTILKLKNSCSGYTSAASPKAVIQTGSENPYTNTAKSVSSLTSTGTTATAVCTAHGYTTGQAIDMTGATPTGYNKAYAMITVVDANTFTYTVASGLASPATGTIKAASYTAGNGNQAFRHYIKNLTVDVGTGNAGAVGIDFLVNNRGGIYNVTIKSSDSGLVGYTGLMMDRAYPGPGIIKNLTVTGFTTGISMRSAAEYSMTFDNITLNSQLGDGMLINDNTATIYNLTSNNSVPVIDTTTATSHVALVNGTFTGGASGNTAITGTGAVYARNLTSTGYGTVIGSVTGGASPVNVPEYESTATYKGFSGNISGSMELPIEETPDFNDTNMADWENAATAAPVVGGDYLASIQAAIDSGKPVVYLPQGSYTVSNTIHLRGSVQKFIGCCAYLSPLAGFPSGAPLIEYDGGTAAYTDIQNIRIDGTVEHNSSQNLALENVDVTDGYSNTSSGTGALFMEDAISGALAIDYPQYVWARQLDIEGLTTTFVTNNGGVVWLFGFKTENNSTSGSIIVNENSGWTELLGGFFYVLSTPTVPMIVNNNSYLSADYCMDAYESSNFPENIQDIEGTTYNFTKTNCPLYSAAQETYTTSFVTGQTLGTIRSNYTGWVGCKFTVGSTPITVTDLGRWIVSSTGGAHTVKLVTASTGVDVPGGSVGISTAGAATGAFQYATLSAPVTLAANTAYYLVSSETSGGDSWYDDGSTTLTTTSAAAINNAELTSGSIYTSDSTANHSYGPVSFKYY